MWCQQKTHYRRRIIAAYTAFLLLLVAIFTTAIFSADASANTSPARTLNFQGRLLRSTGAVVPDGHYNIQFNIYEGGSGTTANNPDGSLVWTENYINNNTNGGVRVKNGLFSVNLGSVVPFGDSIDWNANTIWLSMNVAGSANDCMSFGIGTCVADGEMLPMKQMTATPFAMNAGQLGGKSADSFLQLAQGVQTDNSNATSIALNKTGSGDFVRLQKDGDEVFAISPNGNIRLGGVDDKTIAIQPAAPGQNGANLTLSAGDGGGSGTTNGGNLVLSGGAGSGMGAPGLIVMNTPTFQTASNDASCFTGGAVVSESCTFTSVSVNNSAVLVAGFSQEGQVATLPDPTITTAGRIMYITAASNSEDFVLRINEGSAAEKNVGIRAHMSFTLLWNGTDWTLASAPAQAPTLNEYASNGGAETPGDTASTFPPDTWSTIGSATVSRNTNPAYVQSGQASVQLDFPTYYTDAGAANQLIAPLKPNTSYDVTFQAGIGSGPNATLRVHYLRSASTQLSNGTVCTNSASVPSTAGTTTISCSFTTPASAIAADNYLAIYEQVGLQTRTLYIDNLSVKQTGTHGLDIQTTDTPIDTRFSPTADKPANDLFTLNAQDAAPGADMPHEDLLGSMYYDEELGKIQCYESEGWGSCNTAPDAFVSLSPAYPGVVVDESNTNSATFSTGFCSGSLGINSDGDTPVCREAETHNYYQLHNTAATSQSSLSTLYVTHTLPDNFKEFVPDATSVTAKTLGDGSEVRYQIYKNTNGELTPCGEIVTASSGSSQTWRQAATANSSDPSSCGFTAGDSVLFKIELALSPKPSAESTAAAYVSDINFIYTQN